MGTKRYFDITVEYVDNRVPPMMMRGLGVGIDGDKLTITSPYLTRTSFTVPLENVFNVSVRLGLDSGS